VVTFEECDYCGKRGIREDGTCMYCRNLDAYRSNWNDDEWNELMADKVDEDKRFLVSRGEAARKGFGGIITEKRKFIVGEGGPEKIVRKRLKRSGWL
jgi:hypothetical protein